MTVRTTATPRPATRLLGMLVLALAVLAMHTSPAAAQGGTGAMSMSMSMSMSGGAATVTTTPEPQHLPAPVTPGHAGHGDAMCLARPAAPTSSVLDDHEPTSVALPPYASMASTAPARTTTPATSAPRRPPDLACLQVLRT